MTANMDVGCFGLAWLLEGAYVVVLSCYDRKLWVVVWVRVSCRAISRLR